ncbi:MAG: protein kinase [Planctomycetia bacterium]|nr:protein kinase [Planctomycetia bacterium]
MDTVFVSWRAIRYEKLRNLNEGGIGKVSLALATNGPMKGTLFAVKEFSPDSSEKEAWRQDFMREMGVLRDCHHPAIVRVFDDGVIGDDRPFFVMEYLPHNLREAIKENKLDELAKLSVVMQLLSTLDYLARREPYVVHRDIKPQNIFLKSASCVLGDFGLIYHDWTAETKTKSSIPQMAQMYRTPELVAFHNTGVKPTPASDVFQLGLVVAELFTGKNPLRPGGASKPIKLDEIDNISGPLGPSIKTRLEEMLAIPTGSRLPASRLLPLWMDLYRTLEKRLSTEQVVARLTMQVSRATAKGPAGSEGTSGSRSRSKPAPPNTPDP